MDERAFVDVIRRVVRDGAKRDILSSLRQPPGRRPPEQLIDKSRWYNALTDVDKAFVESVVGDCVTQAVFGFLCVIDGVRAIEDGSDRGSLELYYTKAGASSLLNRPEGLMLHDLL